MDVGGTVYSVSRAVLMSVPNSWLARLANGGIQLPRTAQDIRFIDRDAQARPPANDSTPDSMLQHVNVVVYTTSCFLPHHTLPVASCVCCSVLIRIALHMLTQSCEIFMSAW